MLKKTMYLLDDLALRNDFSFSFKFDIIIDKNRNTRLGGRVQVLDTSWDCCRVRELLYLCGNMLWRRPRHTISTKLP